MNMPLSYVQPDDQNTSNIMCNRIWTRLPLCLLFAIAPSVGHEARADLVDPVTGSAYLDIGDMAFFDCDDLASVEIQAASTLTGYTLFTFWLKPLGVDNAIGADFIDFNTDPGGFNQVQPGPDPVSLFLDDDGALDEHGANNVADSHFLLNRAGLFILEYFSVDTDSEVEAYFADPLASVSTPTFNDYTAVAQLVLKDGFVGVADIQLAVNDGDGNPVGEADFVLTFSAVPEANVLIIWTGLTVGVLIVLRRRQAAIDVPQSELRNLQRCKSQSY